MQKITIILLSLLLINACSDEMIDNPNIESNNLAKQFFNSEWRKQGVGPDLWFYRMTVLDAPADTQELGIAEGHVLHPEVIRWEITENLLIGWRAFSSILNSEHEHHRGVNRNYRGAPVVAYAITSHFDIEPRVDPFFKIPLGGVFESFEEPWHARKFFRVDWAKNLISQLTRGDEAEGVPSTKMDNAVTHLIDDGFLGNNKRKRFGDDYFDFTTRHPVANRTASRGGAYGRSHKADTAAVVIDVRHFFLRKKMSDFDPLPYPDEVMELAEDHGKAFLKSEPHKKVAVNKRFGLFRTRFDGRPIYDASIGSVNGAVNNATIFNIWKKSRNSDGVIPIEQREIKPIIYYTNVLHPDHLLNASFRVASEWDMAFKNAVFYAQPGKYQKLDDVPPLFVLKKNSCSLKNVLDWLTIKRLDLADAVESAAKVTVSSVTHSLKQALNQEPGSSFSARQSLEINAKRELEKICAALEYFTGNSDEQFIYQRPGDLRFNLLNLEVENNTTAWSGYGPMFADPMTGEILSATANINLKYIDRRAQKMAKQVGLLKADMPGLGAVFGSGSSDEKKLINKDALATIHERVMNRSDSRVTRELVNNTTRMSMNTISDRERIIFQKATELLARSMNGEVDKQKNPQDDVDIFGTNNQLHVKNQKNALMDPVRFVDDIAAGVALKLVNLSEHERFLKIREIIFEAVALHEIGHNVGLRHNMAGAADALNYGEHYWQTNQLPSDLLTVSQKNGLYSSIMNYHANLANLHGLGLYDKAAIKWAYGHMLEVFPRENLEIDIDKIEMARWLKLHDYQTIPTAMLKGIKSIGERQHVKVLWNDHRTLAAFPNNAVPYAYCEDPFGQAGPRCAAYDFGPDMQSSAQWLKSRYLENYLLTHFAQDETWDSSEALSSVSNDIAILNRFTNIMVWYYRHLKDDPDFKGSYAEQDYLRALAIGINHFVHVIGSPESGAHISAPAWTIEDKESFPLGTYRLSPTNVLVPFNNLSDCNARAVTSINSAGKIVGRFNYKFIEVPLGLGRPLYSRVSSDVEDPSVLYSGTSLVKKYALYLLMAPLFASGSSETIEKNDLLSMTWYRMFPEIVSKIYAGVITKNYQELGPILVDDTVMPRNIIDEQTLKTIDYSSAIAVQPAIDNSMPMFALENAIRFFSSTSTDEFNLPKSIKISCRGCSDDVDYADVNGGKNVVRFHHLSGQEYKAVLMPDMVSIGAQLLDQANRQKERFLKLSECIHRDDVRMSDPFCQCVKTIERRAFDQWMCCDEKNTNCTGPMLESVNQGVCTILDLEKRKEQSRDQLDMMTGFIDALRMLMKQAGI